MSFFNDPNKTKIIFATHSCLECTEQQLLRHRRLQHVDTWLNCNVHNGTDGCGTDPWQQWHCIVGAEHGYLYCKKEIKYNNVCGLIIHKHTPCQHHMTTCTSSSVLTEYLPWYLFDTTLTVLEMKKRGVCIHLHHKLLDIYIYIHIHTRTHVDNYIFAKYSMWLPLKICRSMAGLLWPVRKVRPWSWSEFYS